MEDEEIFEWIEENWERVEEEPDIWRTFKGKERKKIARQYIEQKLEELGIEEIREVSFWGRVKSGVVEFFRRLFRL